MSLGRRNLDQTARLDTGRWRARGQSRSRECSPGRKAMRWCTNPPDWEAFATRLSATPALLPGNGKETPPV
jgi:hypothetical protein